MTQAFETKDTKQSSEDILTKRHLKFLMLLLEQALIDQELDWKLKDCAELFAKRENRT